MSDTKKVPLQLTPYNALAICSFINEFDSPDNRAKPECKALFEAYDEFYNQVCLRMTDEQIDDAYAEHHVNELIGKEPPNIEGTQTRD